MATLADAVHGNHPRIDPAGHVSRQRRALLEKLGNETTTDVRAPRGTARSTPQVADFTWFVYLRHVSPRPSVSFPPFLNWDGFRGRMSLDESILAGLLDLLASASYA